MPQENVMSKCYAFMQVHFTDIEEETYNDLKDNNKYLWDILSMNYPSHVDFRIYERDSDKLVQLSNLGITNEDEIKDLKELFDGCESFWLEPKDGDDKYSYVALIWSDNVNIEV